MKKFFLSIALLSVLSIFCFGQSKESIKNGAILHCWCWSFKTIEEKLPEIAAAGFAAVQPSPINTCLVGDYGLLEFMSINPEGKWYYHYQPIDWKIGNYQLGTREDFISMCAKAEELGIGVIVDVLPNHTTGRKKDISQDLLDAVGGIENLYHENESKGVKDYSNRLQATTHSMGGLPDVNTENPDFQAYYMNFVNDAIACGADGFRYDTAKHIGLPDDPKDPKAKENDFWPIFTGKKDINGVWLSKSDELFIYGEVLQGGNSREESYGKYMNVVASNYGGVLRNATKRHSFNAKGLVDLKNAAGPEKLVTWVESHDTYANAGESAGLTNFELRAGWAVICARKDGTPLFFSRPKGAEGVQFPGVSKIGDAGNDEFKNPEVVALNDFRKAMIGEDDSFENGENNSILAIKRGNKGVVIINAGDKPKKVSFNVDLPDGNYVDKAHGNKFKVKNGILSGGVRREEICVIY